MSALTCSRCGQAANHEDNFCRNCGRQLTVNLPAVAPNRLPVSMRSVPRPLVGSMAVLALGTGLEWLARRAAGGAARAVGRALIGQGDTAPAREVKSSTPAQVDVDEVVYIRKVQLRR